MKRRLCIATLMTAIAYGQNTDYAKAIAYGQTFKSRSQFLERGMKANRVQLASAWAKDGISKYVTFFTDRDAIAAAAAQAHQELRPFTADDAAKLPLTGLVYAHVEIHGRGDIPVRKVAKRYVRNAAHLVIQFGPEIIQPLSRELLNARDASAVLPVALFSWWDVGNVSLLTGGELGLSGAKAELEFVFQLTPEQLQRKAMIILIDGDGNQHKESIDFNGMFK